VIDRDLIDVLMKAEAAGIHIFFSAGNNHEETGAAHDACTPNSIWLHKSYDCLATVGTCDLDGTMWSYSSRGPGQFFGEARTRPMPDLVAPTPRNGRIVFGTGDRTLTRGWGTSGASPQVAGLAALILALEPRLRPDEVRELIRSTTKSFGGVGGTCQGKGMVDCEAAVNRVARHSRSRRKEVTFESRSSI
jgi:serine protease AprX